MTSEWVYNSETIKEHCKKAPGFEFLSGGGKLRVLHKLQEHIDCYDRLFAYMEYAHENNEDLKFKKDPDQLEFIFNKTLDALADLLDAWIFKQIDQELVWDKAFELTGV